MRIDTRVSPVYWTAKWQSWVGPGNEGGEMFISSVFTPHTSTHAHNIHLLMPHTLTLIYHPPPPTHTPLSPSHTGLSGKSLSSLVTWSDAVEITPGCKRCLPQDQSQGGVDKLSASPFSQELFWQQNLPCFTQWLGFWIWFSFVNTRGGAEHLCKISSSPTWSTIATAHARQISCGYLLIWRRRGRGSVRLQMVGRPYVSKTT